jgi:hypothetical protein
VDDLVSETFAVGCMGDLRKKAISELIADHLQSGDTAQDDAFGARDLWDTATPTEGRSESPVLAKGMIDFSQLLNDNLHEACSRIEDESERKVKRIEVVQQLLKQTGQPLMFIM